MTETLSIRLDSATKQRLDALARQSKRSKSFLAAEAIAAYVEQEEWQLGEIHAALGESIRVAEECLSGMSEQKAMGNWRLMTNGKQIFSRPRVEVLRSIMLNHWYHHRGQLSVYLRLLDVPVPVIYGRSADENPFA